MHCVFISVCALHLDSHNWKGTQYGGGGVHVSYDASSDQAIQHSPEQLDAMKQQHLRIPSHGALSEEWIALFR